MVCGDLKMGGPPARKGTAIRASDAKWLAVALCLKSYLLLCYTGIHYNELRAKMRAFDEMSSLFEQKLMLAQQFAYS